MLPNGEGELSSRQLDPKDKGVSLRVRKERNPVLDWLPEVCPWNSVGLTQGTMHSITAWIVQYLHIRLGTPMPYGQTLL